MCQFLIGNVKQDFTRLGVDVSKYMCQFLIGNVKHISSWEDFESTDLCQFLIGNVKRIIMINLIFWEDEECQFLIGNVKLKINYYDCVDIVSDCVNSS